MSYIPLSLYQIIGQVNHSLFLPHIQRPFVWERDQMRRLFDSLMRNYPIQTFLFWRTKDEIKARRFMSSIDWDANLHEYYDENKTKEGVEKIFVLDGQQRLQTLYALFYGSIKSEDGKTNLDAYVDITSGYEPNDEGLLYRLEFSDEPMDTIFYRLHNLFGVHASKNAEEIADELNDKFDDILTDETKENRKERQKRVRRNCGQLVSLLKETKHFWIQELDGIANEFPYNRVLDIFVRVNSGGTKLDAADLMFAAMKEGWDDIEAEIEEIVELLNFDGKLNFDKSFVLKCIVVCQGKGAALKPEKFTYQQGKDLLEAIKQNWDKLEDTFRQLRDFIVQELKLYGDKVIRSYNSFVLLFDYLYFNPKPDPQNRLLMRGYYYKAQLFNWYGAQTDSTIDVVHNIVGKRLSGKFPLVEVKNHFAKKRQVELREDDLINSRIRFILLNLVYVEKFGNSPFNVRYQGNEPHIDHIYPQSTLRNTLHLPTTEINDIGNYRFLGATDNIRKRAEPPDSYFNRLKQAGVDIEKHLLLSNFASDPKQLKFDVTTYRSFRDQRRNVIFAIVNKVVNPEL